VLDLGCGRDALAFLVKEARPAAAVTGLDVDGRDVAWARTCVHGDR
jgi:16S rRNA G1207 methylase RsmC